MSTGHGRATTAGETAVANRRPEIDSQPIAASSAPARNEKSGRRGGQLELFGLESGREDGDTELMLLLQTVLLHLVGAIERSHLDRRHGDLYAPLFEPHEAGRDFFPGRSLFPVKSERG